VGVNIKLGQEELRHENVKNERWEETLVGRLANKRPPYPEDDTDEILTIPR
jgi:hypothetical protein